MPELTTIRAVTRLNITRFVLLTMLVIGISGCGSDGMGSQPQGKSEPSQGQSLPAVTEPTATTVLPPPTPTTGSLPTKGAGTTPPTPTTPESQAAAGTDKWTLNNRASADGLKLSYRYPPTWTAELTYCPSAKNTNQGLGSHLSSGCASTDFLFGEKAADVAASVTPDKSQAMTVNGKRAVRQVATPFDTSKVSSTYTVLVYGEGTAPIFGFVTYIGAGTSEAEQQAILATLDGVASTLSVEK